MEFNSQLAIYLQIAEHVCDRIQLLHWPVGEKIPSVRELAVSLEVNPNTVMRSYEHLQQLGVIHTRRGLGYFVSPDAVSRVAAARKEQFMQEELPQFFRRLFLLGIELDELKERYATFKLRQSDAQ